MSSVPSIMIIHLLLRLFRCTTHWRLPLSSAGEMEANRGFEDLRENSPPGTPKNEPDLDDDDDVMLK